MEHLKVIKVKYGDTLRRFNLRFSATGKLDMNMAMLKEKIAALFDIIPDSDLILMYIDEDGDVITLVDDDDLNDAVQQNINPLRIDVSTCKIRGDKYHQLHPSSSGNSVPSNIKSGIVEMLKSVPEPLREGLSSLYLDLLAKAETSPILMDFIQNLSKVSHSFMNTASLSHSVTHSTEENGVRKSVNPDDKEVGKGVMLQRTENLEGDASNCEMLGIGSFKPAGIPVSMGVSPEKNPNEVKKGNSDKQAPKDSYMGPLFHRGFMKYGSFDECPFGGLSLGYDVATHEPKYIHKGVWCDYCGVGPIVGPCFKSKVKEDFDLCSACFSRAGNKDDYYRMDTHVEAYSRKCPPKLDARFVHDVSVMDGTAMAPSTHFTKIWRVRNSGTASWPHGIMLVWIGGYKFCHETSVPIETPVNGVPVDEEFDITLKCKAPEYTGKYTSYWRMSMPSGCMFGEQLWTSIEVIMPAEFPKKPFEDTTSEASDSRPSAQAELRSPSEKPRQVLPLNLQAVTEEGYGSSEDVDGNSAVEEALLFELADMGFKDVELNREVLRTNNYSLDRSVDDLCNTAEWDTIMRELKEMGFCDENVNKKLLQKNKGSVKRAVLDLIAAENAILD